MLVEVAVEPLRFRSELTDRLVIKPLQVAGLEALKKDVVPAELRVEVFHRPTPLPPVADGVGVEDAETAPVLEDLVRVVPPGILVEEPNARQAGECRRDSLVGPVVVRPAEEAHQFVPGEVDVGRAKVGVELRQLEEPEVDLFVLRRGEPVFGVARHGELPLHRQAAVPVGVAHLEFENLDAVGPVGEGRKRELDQVHFIPAVSELLLGPGLFLPRRRLFCLFRCHQITFCT